MHGGKSAHLPAVPWVALTTPSALSERMGLPADIGAGLREGCASTRPPRVSIWGFFPRRENLSVKDIGRLTRRKVRLYLRSGLFRCIDVPVSGSLSASRALAAVHIGQTLHSHDSELGVGSNRGEGQIWGSCRAVRTMHWSPASWNGVHGEGQTLMPRSQWLMQALGLGEAGFKPHLCRVASHNDVPSLGLSFL